MGGGVKMVIHKLLMEMNTSIMIWKCKLATASELRKWSQFTGHIAVNVLLTTPAISTYTCLLQQWKAVVSAMCVTKNA